MAEVVLPRIISYGENVIISLRKILIRLNVNRAVVLVDERFKLAEDALQRALEEEEILSEFVNVGKGPFPREEEVYRLVDRGKRFGAEAVIGIGGSHSIFSSKLVSALMKKHVEKLEEIKPTTPMALEFERPYLITVPICGGWGGSSLRMSVYVDRSRKVRILANRAFIPHSIILDPNLIPALSKRILQSIIGNVLSHAVEAYLHAPPDVVTEALSLQAIRLTLEHAGEALSDPANTGAWERLQIASIMAGGAKASHHIPLTTVMSISLSSSLNLPTGIVSGVLLPRILRFYEQYSRELKERLNDLKLFVETFMGFEQRESFSDHIMEIYRRIGFPLSFEKVGAKAEVVERVITKFLEDLSEGSFGLPLLQPRPSVEQIAEMIRGSFGKDLNS